MALGRIRTDLALEAKEKFEEEHAEVRGVVVKEDYNEEKDIRTTTVIIETENGAKTMGRPQGVYITLEAPNMSVPDEDYHREISKELAEHMKGLLPEKQELNILVVGLGNRDITPDALGPDVVSNLHITRHIIREYGVQGTGEEKLHSISGLVPGVMGQTGMETLEIVRGVAEETRPDVIIANGYRNQSRFRRGKSQNRIESGDFGNTRNWNRGSYGSGWSNHCQGFYGAFAGYPGRSGEEGIFGGNDCAVPAQYVYDPERCGRNHKTPGLYYFRRIKYSICQTRGIIKKDCLIYRYEVIG